MSNSHTEGEGFGEKWFLRPKDVEQLSGIPASTVREAIYRGDLTARKFRSRGWLITPDDAKAWINSVSVPSGEVTEND